MIRGEFKVTHPQAGVLAAPDVYTQNTINQLHLFHNSTPYENNSEVCGLALSYIME